MQILRLFSYNVFKGASVDTAVLILKRSNEPNDQAKVSIIVSNAPAEVAETGNQKQAVWVNHADKEFGLVGEKGGAEIEAKLRGRSVVLGEFATAYFGIQTFDRTKFVHFHRQRGFKPVIDGGHIDRYMLHRGTEYVDFRPATIKSGGKEEVYEQDRVGVRQIGKVPIATYLPAGVYTLNTIYNIFFTKPTKYTLEFVLGIIASKCLGWFWQRAFFDQKETFPKIKKDALLSIPIPRIDFSKSADKLRHDRLSSLVKQMLVAQKQVPLAQSDADKEFYANKCAMLDRQIDKLVYELYGLTTEEVAVSYCSPLALRQ